MLNEYKLLYIGRKMIPNDFSKLVRIPPHTNYTLILEDS